MAVSASAKVQSGIQLSLSHSIDGGKLSKHSHLQPQLLLNAAAALSDATARVDTCLE